MAVHSRQSVSPPGQVLTPCYILRKLALYVQHAFSSTLRVKFTLFGCLKMRGAIGHSEWKAESSEVEKPVGEELSGRILIIDDDPHFLHVLQRILSGEKFAVTATSDPCEAIEVLRSGSFDLVICDLRMPDCDGLNLLQAVRGAGSEVPVIILTAYGEVDTYLEAMNAGATEYLNKPIKSDELVQVVRNCLRKGNHRRNSKRSNNV
jgi:two-component system response regulator (stage 0 sporulation protein F)